MRNNLKNNNDMTSAEKAQESISRLEKICNNIMYWMGSTQSLIVHTLIFILSFLLPVFNIVDFDKMLMVLTNVLSLEAIYLAIFIQMSVNKSSEHIEDLRDDVTEIQEDIEDIQEDIEEISEDIEEISEDIEEISEDIEEINEDIEDIQEDIEEINEEEEDEDHNERAKTVMLKSNVYTNKNAIKSLQEKIQKMEEELNRLRNKEE